jgi:hypothetical protein
VTPADYDGDGKTDVSVFRPSTGTWHWHNSGSQTFQAAGWGANGDIAVPADHDGDHKADLIIFRPFYRCLVPAIKQWKHYLAGNIWRRDRQAGGG